MALKVVSLFCGCGGLDYGFAHTRGFATIFAADRDQHAVDAYNANFEPVAVVMDVWKPTAAALAALGKADVVIGGPPCVDFSTAGKMTLGRNADLTSAYARLVCKARPRYFVLENVPALLTVGSEVYVRISRMFERAGYGLSANVVHAVDYGVPQTRRRLIILGVLGGSDGELDAALAAQKSPQVTMRQQLLKHKLLPKRTPYTAVYYMPRGTKQRGIFPLDGFHPTVRTKPSTLPPPNYKFHPGDATRDRTKLLVLNCQQLGSIHSYPASFVWPDRASRCAKLIGNSVPPRLSLAVARVIAGHASR